MASPSDDPIIILNPGATPAPKTATLEKPKKKTLAKVKPKSKKR